jgi:hypothetical protein
MLGHQHLKAAKRKAAWGVGRHIMGSQVFDYWKDPFGNELEHWTDGDLFTAADPPQKMPMSALLAVQWGTPHPMFAGKRDAPPPTLSLFHGADAAHQAPVSPPAQRNPRMKLATYTANGQTRTGIVVGDQIIDTGVEGTMIDLIRAGTR